MAIQFQDFAAWQQQLHRSGALDAQMTYWQQVFADTIPQLHLPTDRPRQSHPDHEGALHLYRLGKPLSTALRQYAQQQHCTLFVLLSTVTQLMLFRHSQQTDLVMGTPVIGRDHVALEPLIGCFLNVLPLRLHCAEQQTFAQLMAQNRQTITAAFAHQQLAFDQLLETVGYRKQAGRHALFDVQIILQNNPQMQLDFGHTHLEMHPEETVSAKFDLNIMFSDEADIELQLEYATALFDAPRTAEMVQDIVGIARYVTQQMLTTDPVSEAPSYSETLTIQDVLTHSTTWRLAVIQAVI
ncbi:condensation domain-containing protein [Vibrio sp. PP-XX7]